MRSFSRTLKRRSWPSGLLSCSRSARRRPQLPFPLLAESLARPAKSLPELPVVERLQNVVEGVQLEGAHRIAVEGGDEHHHRHPIGADLLDDREAVLLRHLDVEHHHLGDEPLDGLDRRGAVAALADDLHSRVPGEPEPHAVARQRLVVDDEHPERMVVGHLASEAVDLNGKAMRASPPPAAPFSSEIVAESP